MVTAMTDDPEQQLSQVDLLGTDERERILETWNDTVRPTPRLTLPELFEAQVARTPDAPALVFGADTLTYRALNARANRVANYLGEIGVGPEDRVALCVERSIEMVVGLLAILKAGGAYVPLDPQYPAERLAYMLDHSQPLALISTSSIAARLPAAPAHCIQFDRDAATIADRSAENPPVKAQPGNAAYIIYTSGSTGEARKAWSFPTAG